MNIRGKRKEPKSGTFFNKKSELANSKILLLLLFMALLFIAIIVKLLYINVVQGEELTRRALNQLTRTETVKADRGIIYDKNKKEMAINVTRGNAYYNMNFDREKFKNTAQFNSYVKKTTEEDAKKIAAVLEVNPEEILKHLKGDKTVKIAGNLSREQTLELRSLGIAKLSIEDVVKRFYPYGNMASNLIGFTDDEGNGQYGIESKYDEELSGIPGKNISIKNNNMAQIPLTDEQNFAPKEGLYPVLTLDTTIQQFAEEAAENAKVNQNAKKVSIIVQDTITGEILAMANSDSFDLNNPKEPVEEDQVESWEEMTDEEKKEKWFSNWNNICVSSQYEPGSTFKLITAAAALEENTTNPNKEYTCNGSIDIGIKITCTAKNLGSKSMAQALAESCNVSFVKIGQELGKERFYKYLKAFGFGSKTGIDLPAEAIGIVPESADEISSVRLGTMSYGHGVAVTPIQLINAVSAIANGGKLNVPRVVDRLEDKNGNVITKTKTQTMRQVISESTSDTMKELMKKVVDEGTGKLAKIDGYQVGGKTGTANIPKKNGRGYEENKYISSFIGVAPLNDPKLTVLVIVEEPKGDFFASTVAVPAAREVMSKTLKYLNVPPTEQVDEKTEKNQITVPNVRNLLLSDAGKSLVDLGLTFNTNSDNITDVSTVIRQNPSPGIVVTEGSIVDLYVEDNDKDTKVMPNLVGKKDKDLDSILNALDLEYKVLGSGEVLSQSVKPGSKIEKSSLVEFMMSVPAKVDKKDSDNSNESENSSKDKKSKTDKNSNNKKKGKKEKLEENNLDETD
ncbi:penicillin-binding transpeptidase domain-containing protein [Peptoniphilus catoniae]|uniref:penicillin-binding transpeptidase domain-containing protein n=1 Tax=Peptoniphilus catoniae TaxID=1660341 RepID=UPI0010FEE0B6|nr:penicillin-binding transpeptidase domain-containing protein [Peptoniphilus catoniae]